MYDQLFQVSWGDAKEPREKAICTQVVEGEGEVWSELGLKVLWGVRWDFSPSTTTTSCTSGILEFFKSNFHPPCLHPELHWIPPACALHRRGSASFVLPKTPLLLYQTCPQYLHSLQHLQSLPLAWLLQSSAGFPRLENLPFSCYRLSISSFSLPIFKKVCDFISLLINKLSP